MSVYLDLGNGRPACDLSCSTSAFNGPVLGPFLGVHLTRDEVRVATTANEFAETDPANWIKVDSASDLRFTADDGHTKLNLMPLYQIRDQRYSVYWNLHGEKDLTA